MAVAGPRTGPREPAPAGAITFDDIRGTMPLAEPVTAAQPAAGRTKKKKRHKRKHGR